MGRVSFVQKIDWASLVGGQSETDIGEQGQGITDIVEGELFHGLGLIFCRIFEIGKLGFD
jgi:hypothetical protein